MAEKTEEKRKDDNWNCLLCMCCGGGEDSEENKQDSTRRKPSKDTTAKNFKDLSGESNSEDAAEKALENAKVTALRAKQNLEAKNTDSKNMPGTKYSGKNRSEESGQTGKESQMSEVEAMEQYSDGSKEQESDEDEMHHMKMFQFSPGDKEKTPSKKHINRESTDEIDELTHRFDTLKMIGSANGSEKQQDSEKKTDAEWEVMSDPGLATDGPQREKDTGPDGGKDQEQNKDDQSQEEKKDDQSQEEKKGEQSQDEKKDDQSQEEKKGEQSPEEKKDDQIQDENEAVHKKESKFKGILKRFSK